MKPNDKLSPVKIDPNLYHRSSPFYAWQTPVFLLALPSLAAPGLALAAPRN
jgi:hypothetical protein